MCTYQGPRLEGLGVPKERGLAVIRPPLVNLLRGQQSGCVPIPFRSCWKLVGSMSLFPLPRNPSFKPSPHPYPRQSGLIAHRRGGAGTGDVAPEWLRSSETLNTT